MNTPNPPVFIKIARRRWQRPGYEFACRTMRTAYYYRKCREQRKAEKLFKQKHYAMLAKRGQEARAKREALPITHRLKPSPVFNFLLFSVFGLVGVGLAAIAPFLGIPFVILAVWAFPWDE